MTCPRPRGRAEIGTPAVPLETLFLLPWEGNEQKADGGQQLPNVTPSFQAKPRRRHWPAVQEGRPGSQWAKHRSLPPALHSSPISSWMLTGLHWTPTSCPGC